jgi:hypothetical protein
MPLLQGIPGAVLASIDPTGVFYIASSAGGLGIGSSVFNTIGFDSTLVFNRVSNQIEVASTSMVALITY